MNHLLIIEDDKSLSNGIMLALQNEQITVSQSFDYTSARKSIRENSYDLLICDINLPDGNGLELLCEVKQENTVPIILLTANDMETDIVAGLEMGADDYITKPFSLAVLRARVNTQLRKQSISKTKVFRQDDLMFDFKKMEFYKDSNLIELSKTEQKLLRILIENKGITLKRSMLIDYVWTDGAEYVDENALSVTIKRLRNKLEDMPAKPNYIKTIYGIGYTWVVK